MSSLIEADKLVCCPHTKIQMDFIDSCSFWVEGVMTLIVGCFGILGNLLSISVLMGKDMKNAFNQLLIVLASVDSVLIMLALFDKSITFAFEVNFGDAYTYMYPYFIYPMTNIVLVISIYLVLAIAFERYLAVCHPYYYRNVSNTQSVAVRVAKLTLPVFIIALIINIPKFFETELVERSFQGQTRLEIEITKLRRNPDYINYYVNWFSLLGTGVGPMAALICFNIKIYRQIKATRKKRELNRTNTPNCRPLPSSANVGMDMAREAKTDVNRRSSDGQLHANVHGNAIVSNVSKQDQEVSKRDIKMAITLIAIVLVFFTCHLPRVLLNLHEFFMVAQINSCGPKFCPPVWFLCAITFSHLLLVLNSSVNIIIYCSVGEKFRQGLTNKLHLHFLHRINLFSHTTSSPSNLHKNGNLPMTRRLHEDNMPRVARLEPRKDAIQETQSSGNPDQQDPDVKPLVDLTNSDEIKAVLETAM